ncbi:hypothetical protein Tco_0051862 [Tanacetum coccineum]
MLPLNDESSPTFTTFSNPLFDSDNDFSSNDDESFSDEDVLKEIYSNPLFDEEIISDKIDASITSSPKFILLPLEQFSGELAHIDLIPPRINEDNLDPEGDIHLVESHVLKYSSCPKFADLDSFLSNPTPIDDLITEDKVFDPEIHEKSFSPTFVKLTFEDRHYFPITFVIRIFLSYFTYLVDSLFPLSFGSEDTIFDPDIFTFHFSSLKSVAYENLMVIFPFFCFCPKDKGIQGESS